MWWMNFDDGNGKCWTKKAKKMVVEEEYGLWYSCVEVVQGQAD